MARTRSAQDSKALLPDLILAFPDGRRSRLSEHRGDRSLVALFSGGAECGPCRHVVIGELCRDPEEYAQAGATVLLVLRCSPVEAELVRHRDHLTVPVLLDETGEACRAVGALMPGGRVATAIVVTDCSGRIYLNSRPDQNELLPTREAVLACLRGILDRVCSSDAG